jgi:hypothetical protein
MKMHLQRSRRPPGVAQIGREQVKIWPYNIVDAHSSGPIVVAARNYISDVL